MTERHASSLPVARVERRPRWSWAWVLPLAALAFVGVEAARLVASMGPRIIVRVDDGHGIEAGDALLYRGIEVGHIEEAHLTSDLGSVELFVRLDPAAEGIAVRGSRFWIVHPHLAIDSIQGLETVVGARHLEVDPGPPGAEPRREFTALSEAPVLERLEEGGLELWLEASSRFGLVAGAPVTYRGVRIGRVLDVALAPDATAVVFHLRVRPDYAALVRVDSVFWETGGVELGLSLTEGLRLDVSSLRSLIVGGIALATPTQPGVPAAPGSRFPLHAEPQEEWQSWNPALPVGGAPPLSPRPPVRRAVLRWKEGRIFTREKRRMGWVLVVPGGVIGPLDLLRAPAGAHAGSAVLEVDGVEVDLSGEPEWTGEGLARRSLELEKGARLGGRAQGQEGVRPLGIETEGVAIFTASGRAPRAVAASRLVPGEDGWLVDETISFEEDYDGAAVVARADGALLGLLLVENERGRIVPLPAEAWR